MIRCRLCLVPDTRPDTHFIDGICSACVSYARREEIDWGGRERQLEAILKAGRNTTGYDCIVPSSGGKDSHYQVHTLLGLGARPLVVTASTCHLTPIGRRNIDNLARYATTLEFTPDRNTRAKLNRAGLDLVGDISWPEHCSIFTLPFRVAAKLGIPLIFYGENPQEAYGGPPQADQAIEMTRRWVTEFGGFLGLRPQDLVGREGITEREMEDYRMPPAEAMDAVGVRAYFLGQFKRWDSWDNARTAVAMGMDMKLPTPANAWGFENLDNAQTGLHDHMMFRKYGYGRMVAQLSVDIRAKRLGRQEALSKVNQNDGAFPEVYAGVPIAEVLERIQVTRGQLSRLLDRFTNWEVFEHEQAQNLVHRPTRCSPSESSRSY